MLRARRCASRRGAFVDWGKAYCASNGIAAEGTWRTLSKDEWTYLFNDRTMTNGKERYSNAVAVGGVTIEGKTYKGAFLYPDNYNGDVVSGSMTWDEINAAGIVFLPATTASVSASLQNLPVPKHPEKICYINQFFITGYSGNRIK